MQIFFLYIFFQASKQNIKILMILFKQNILNIFNFETVTIQLREYV